MELILYKTNNSNNTVNKTLENGLSIDINLKADTDLTRPQITLSNIEGINERRFNYIFIPDLNKYYFISNITSINNYISRLDCEVDLLMTYQTEIMASHARLRRNIKTGDYLDFSNDKEIFKTVTINKSNVSLTGEESSPILTTIGL